MSDRVLAQGLDEGGLARRFATAAMLAGASLLSIQLTDLHGRPALFVSAGAFLAAGLVAGSGLRRGWLAMLGMGLTFCAANTAAVLIAGLQSNYGVASRGLTYGVVYGLVFAMAGMVGFAIAGLGGRSFGFGVAGMFCGGLVAGAVTDMLGNVWIGPVMPVLPVSVPWILGGIAARRSSPANAKDAG